MRYNELSENTHSLYTDENRRSKAISEREVHSLLESGLFDEALKADPIIRHVARATNDFYYTEPSKFNRLARNTHNYMNLMVDNFASWRNYPKRSQSLICSSNNYSRYHRVLFANNARIGVCPESDFWYSFNMKFLREYGVYIDAVPDFCEILNYTADTLQVDLSPTDYNAFCKGLEEMSTTAKEMFPDKDYAPRGVSLFYLDKVIDLLETHFAPDRNDFLLTSISEFKHIGDGHEVWSDSNALLISYTSDIGKSLG